MAVTTSAFCPLGWGGLCVKKWGRSIVQFLLLTSWGKMGHTDSPPLLQEWGSRIKSTLRVLHRQENLGYFRNQDLEASFCFTLRFTCIQSGLGFSAIPVCVTFELYVVFQTLRPFRKYLLNAYRFPDSTYCFLCHNQEISKTQSQNILHSILCIIFTII